MPSWSSSYRERKRETVMEEAPYKAQEGTSDGNTGDRPAGDESSESTDPGGKPTIDEPTGPALDLAPDEFDKQAEDQDETQ